MMNFDILSAMVKRPLTQCVPSEMLDALRYCHYYIGIAQDAGCTPFNEFVMRVNGFEPLDELTDNQTVVEE